ncbi:hypothetical protein [Pedobacter psychroterrae]|uniref:Uncharacterized protein n=1 Tax=Pedobacter psychroterrae TaxID=2530453 RepID=A0A4R0NSY8_9SPHI|nr:hypothetical protein [Pedobacter psychroterrae]TCD03218.1 hypothetical protein EZ437_04390 [Pedobacter psychroterrae]
MKSIKQLDNTAKAKLLHELFPEEVKPFIEHLKQVCSDFEEHQQQYRESWDFGFFSFDEWLSLSRQTMKRIETFEFNMLRSSKVFSDQLCFNLQALFVNDRIIKYADKISVNEKFKLMVQVLYH